MRILDRITESKILWRLRTLLPKLEGLVNKYEEGGKVLGRDYIISETQWQTIFVAIWKQYGIEKAMNTTYVRVNTDIEDTSSDSKNETFVPLCIKSNNASNPNNINVFGLYYNQQDESAEVNGLVLYDKTEDRDETILSLQAYLTDNWYADYSLLEYVRSYATEMYEDVEAYIAKHPTMTVTDIFNN